MPNRRRKPLTLEQIQTRSNIVSVVLTVFIILSTILSALTFGAVYRVREILRAQLETATEQIGTARQQTVYYDFPLQQSFPVSTTVQLNETLDVPVDTIVPVRQSIMVPVEVPVVGRVELPVELDFDVPVSTTVTVVITKEIPIETSVDLNTSIPLEIDLAQPPLGDVLRELQEALEELLGQL